MAASDEDDFSGDEQGTIDSEATTDDDDFSLEATPLGSPPNTQVSVTVTSTCICTTTQQLIHSCIIQAAFKEAAL